MKKGFDNNKYVKIQSKKIKERFKLFDKPLYESYLSIHLKKDNKQDEKNTYQ